MVDVVDVVDVVASDTPPFHVKRRAIRFDELSHAAYLVR